MTPELEQATCKRCPVVFTRPAAHCGAQRLYCSMECRKAAIAEQKRAAKRRVRERARAEKETSG